MPSMKSSWGHRVILSAWRDILEASESDKSFTLLVDVLADRVESKVGVRPDDNDVVNFLRSLQRSTDSPESEPKGSEPSPLGPGDPPVKSPPVRIKELVILGRPYPCKNQSKVMAIVFEKLQEEDPNFLRRFYEHSRNRRGGGRQYLGRNQQELFGDNKRSHEKIGRDWVISTNYQWEKKEEIIQLAAVVAGLKFGRDIIITTYDD